VLLALRLGALVAILAAGCASPAPAASPTPAAVAPPAALPESVNEARALRARGASWTNVQIRDHYLALVARVAGANEQWKKEGLGAEERARRAYELRYDARMTCRAMMSDAEMLAAIERRDERKFGHKDGPTFDELVLHERKKGLTGDAVYEAIVASAQRTDAIINELVGDSPP
jgi:hypothetical protein